MLALFFVVPLLSKSQQLSSDVLRAFSNHTLIYALYKQSHADFGCQPDPTVCPSWDCAAFSSGIGCVDAHDATSSAVEAATLSSWLLCYDRGLRSYAFTIEGWCGNEKVDCCHCRVQRLYGPNEPPLTCSECTPFRTQCFEDSIEEE